MSEYVLCYVRGCWAYFTTNRIDKQWGDDWDDAPYEHNAGLPYSDEGIDIIKVAWDGCFDEPSEGHNNSPYSVETINSGSAPWLRGMRGTPANGINIFAGCTVEEFCRNVKSAGGGIWKEEK